MEHIKYVIDELNQVPFNQNLNLIAYDNLRDEQRLDLLIQILNVIDSKLNLPSIRFGDIEDIVTTILDTLRIFKYSPPAAHSNPNEFRTNLILADKDLMTNIFEWLLRNLPLLKKRAYLARFLVKIELSPDVEGDQDVLVLYKQYLNLIEEFKKFHSSYEMQKKSIDSIIELQKDIKSMELEKNQIKNKLDIVKRRVNFDVADNSSTQQTKFELVRAFVMARHENEKLQRQLREQLDKIDAAKKLIKQQQNELNDSSVNDWKESIQSPEVLLYKFKDEIDIKQKLAKDVLPSELNELRTFVRDMENISQRSEIDIKDQLSKTMAQIQALTDEVNDLVEKKLLDKETEEDRLSHYRQNAQTVAKKKEELIKQCEDLEKNLTQRENKLEELRARFCIDDDSTLRGDSLKLYIEKMSRRENEMTEMKEELNRISSDIDELQSKLHSLKQQEKETLKEIDENEEIIGLEGYFQMKESTLNSALDDIDDNEWESGKNANLDQEIKALQNNVDKIKSSMIAATKEVKILKEELHEAEAEFEMKKRQYDTAAAGLEAELSRCEAEMDRLSSECDQLDAEQFEIKARLLAFQTEKDQLFGPSTAPAIIENLKKEIESETKLQEQLRAQQAEWNERAHYYRRQMEMWRDLRIIFEVKSKLLAEKLERQNGNQSTFTKDHLVIND